MPEASEFTCSSCGELAPPLAGEADGVALCVRCRPAEDAAPLVLRVHGLRQTVELLRLGGAIEALPGVAALALVRGEPGDAWFAVTPPGGGSRLERAHALAADLERLPEYRITALATEMGVEVDAASIAEQPQPSAPPVVVPEAAPPTLEPVAEESAAPPTLAHPPGAETLAPRHDGVPPEERPGGAAPLSEHLTLIVAPFHSFVRLNEFRAALRALPGVRGARVRRFYRGSLQLAVEYDDPASLLTRLAELPGFRWQLVSNDGSHIEITLDEASTGDAPAARAAG